MAKEAKIKLHVKCLHNIPVRTEYNTTHVIVFELIEIDTTKPVNTTHNYIYTWKTATSTALSFHEGEIYDIQGYCDEDNHLSHVDIIKSEQKLSPENSIVDAYEIIFGKEK